MANIYKLSLKALRRIVEKGWPLANALQRDERITALGTADKELVTRLLTETLRHFGEINNFTRGPDYILALGAAAMKILQLPPQPVIRQLVQLDEDPKYQAILNRLSQKEFIPNIKLNYPNWMTGSWRKAYGEARAQEIMEVMMHPPVLISLEPSSPPSTLSLSSSKSSPSKSSSPLSNSSSSSSKTSLSSSGVTRGSKASGSGISLRGEAQTMASQINSENDMIDNFLPSSETGNISAKPEILLHINPAFVTAAVNGLNAYLNGVISPLNSTISPLNGAIIPYSVRSLQYEECEGLLKKLNPREWQVLEQERVFPCLDAEGNAIAGIFTAKLKKL